MIKVFEMFAGYGGASFALKKLGLEFECVGFSEIDKFAIKCYEQNHDGKNFGDCTKINPYDIPDFDLLTGGFPCQDVSIAGKRDLTKGRTNLYKEILRIAKIKKPKYMLLENVKGLLSIGKDRNLRDIIINDLNKIGYGVAFKLLNSKEFGIPQNRERVWFVCKLGGWKFGEFQFPIERELKLFIKDILEDDVDNKYYLNQKQITKLFNKDKILNKINNKNKQPFIISLSRKPYHINNNGLVNTLVSAMGTGGGHMPIIIHSLYPRSSKTNKGGSGHLFKKDNTSYCLDTGNTQAIEYNYTIRKLTPKECFRLMGFLNDEINLEGLSDSQKYKLAGNGWDVNLVSLIFKEMFKQKEE